MLVCCCSSLTKATCCTSTSLRRATAWSPCGWWAGCGSSTPSPSPWSTTPTRPSSTSPSSSSTPSGRHSQSWDNRYGLLVLKQSINQSGRHEYAFSLNENSMPRLACFNVHDPVVLAVSVTVDSCLHCPLPRHCAVRIVSPLFALSASAGPFVLLLFTASVWTRGSLRSGKTGKVRGNQNILECFPVTRKSGNIDYSPVVKEFENSWV